MKNCFKTVLAAVAVLVWLGASAQDDPSKETVIINPFTHTFVSYTHLINGSCQQILECGASDGFVLRQVGFIHRNALKLKDLTCLLNELRAAGAADRPDDVELLDVTRMCNGLVQTFAEYAETHKRCV